MAMPARYRDALVELGNGELVVTVGLENDNYLLIYPKPMWEKFEAQLMDMPYDKDVRMFQRRMLGNAQEVTMDGQGRLLISSLLRKQASLDKRAVLIGQVKCFELWDEATWEERNANFTLPDDMMSKLSSLRL